MISQNQKEYRCWKLPSARCCDCTSTWRTGSYRIPSMYHWLWVQLWLMSQWWKYLHSGATNPTYLSIGLRGENAAMLYLLSPPLTSTAVPTNSYLRNRWKFDLLKWWCYPCLWGLSLFVTLEISPFFLKVLDDWRPFIALLLVKSSIRNNYSRLASPPLPREISYWIICTGCSEHFIVDVVGWSITKQMGPLEEYVICVSPGQFMWLSSFMICVDEMNMLGKRWLDCP